jgi:transcription factor E2F7/8
MMKTVDEAAIKTKIRRLYDIINVFKSLGLVRKICLDNKKPGF